MKALTKKILLLSSIVILAGFTSCKDNNEISTKDEFITAINGTWTIVENGLVTLDNEDITSSLLGFEITINNDLSFSTNSASFDIQPLPWPSTGSFTINDDLNQFTRHDGLAINLIELETGEMDLSFQFDDGFEDSNGRISAIKGDWHLVFQPIQ